jgi:formate dehydrogenase subunit delta
MHIEQLVTMANDIANFFRSASDAGAGSHNVADHLRRYWAPPMRKQIIAHLNAGGAGLSDLAREAVEELERASSASSATGEMSSG